MWSIIQNIIVSVLLIYILHTLWNYLLEMCSTKKKKNLVKIQNDKYAAIVNSVPIIDTEDTSLLGMTEEELAQMQQDLFASASQDLSIDTLQ